MALTRGDLAARPLGAVGNLQFDVEQGGTARASRIGVALSDIRRCVFNFYANLKDWAFNAPAKAREQRDALAQVRGNSRLLGDLLGALTAPAGDSEGQAGIVRALARIRAQSRGDLNQLAGWRYCLQTYVEELSAADIKALQSGGAELLRLRDRMLDAGHKDKEDSFAASEVLLDLNRLMSEIRQFFGPLTEEMDAQARHIVRVGMGVFRDVQNNPIGSLNQASLAKLDENTLLNLHNTSLLLIVGWMLDTEALADVALSRVMELHGTGLSSGDLTGDSLDLLQREQARRERQLLLMIPNGPKRAHALHMLHEIERAKGRA